MNPKLKADLIECLHNSDEAQIEKLTQELKETREEITVLEAEIYRLSRPKSTRCPEWLNWVVGGLVALVVWRGIKIN